MGQSRFPKMNLVVDHAGHQVFAAGIDDLGIGRRRDAGVNAFDPLVLDEVTDAHGHHRATNGRGH